VAVSGAPSSTAPAASTSAHAAPSSDARQDDSEAFTDLVAGAGLLGPGGHARVDGAYRQRGSFHLPQSPQPLPVGGDQGLSVGGMGPWGPGLGSYGPLAPQTPEGYEALPASGPGGAGVPDAATTAAMSGVQTRSGAVTAVTAGPDGEAVPGGAPGTVAPPDVPARPSGDAGDMTAALAAVEGLGQAHTTPINPGPPIQLFQHAQGPPMCNLFVFHIPNDMANKDLYALFALFGRVISARIMVDKQSGLTRGFGFVSYENREAAETAIRHLDRFRVGHKRLSVSHKKPRGETGPRGRRFFPGHGPHGGMPHPHAYGPPRGYFPQGGPGMPVPGPGGFDPGYGFPLSAGPMGGDMAVYGGPMGPHGMPAYGFGPHGFGMPPHMPFHDPYGRMPPFGGIPVPQGGPGADVLMGQPRAQAPAPPGGVQGQAAFGPGQPGHGFAGPPGDRRTQQDASRESASSPSLLVAEVDDSGTLGAMTVGSAEHSS